jgi:peptidoglycan/xylan/chitin deacetylase (PgdA/CDA1 family)
MVNRTIVVTSWDDGDPQDLRIAEKLRDAGLAATFYVPISGQDGKPTLLPEDLRTLVSQGFEIGAHTMSHAVLSGLRGQRLWAEVFDCKQVLEQILGQEVPMFCYPCGRYNTEVLEVVRKAGYRGARTTRMLCHQESFRAFEMPTTLQAYPHGSFTYFKNLGKRRDLSGLYRYVFELRRPRSWVELGKKLFDQALQEGGIWHLYGHSWEIQKLGLWNDLQEMLDYVRERPGVIYASNSQTLQLMQQEARPTEGPKIQ